MTKLPEFFFDGTEVGYFRGGAFPKSAGHYQYEPYRGPGHYEMQERLNDGGNPRCYYETGGTRTTFVVRACPEYGVLELSEFESSPITAA
ncbi:MAG: hypothetical protein RL088_3867 [Verrucomicrobiota bacterium]|jgi:hypothetical protein